MAEQAPNYEVVTSQLVIDEAAVGDPDAAARRLEALESLAVLPSNPDAESVADEIIARSNSSEVLTMDRNTVLDELHAARRKILSDYNGDTKAYLRDAQARLEASKRSVWNGKQKSIQRNDVEQRS